MPKREDNQAALDQMCEEYLLDVDSTRAYEKKAPLSEESKAVFRQLLNDPQGAHENLLRAIDEGNLRTMMTPIGPGQGMYSAPSQALCIEPGALEQASVDRAVAHNLNFTLAHECRHARDGREITDMMENFRGSVLAKAQERDLPHDYTQIVRGYLGQDRTLEERAETAGLNAHVSKVIAEKGQHATLRDVYEASPRDMAPYVDITPSQGFLGRDSYAYKPGLVVGGDGLHLNEGSQATLDAMGRYFYDAQDYDWKQGLKATLDVINSAEQDATAVKDPRSPPGIDFAALGVGPPPDALCRGMLQHVVDSSLPRPNAIGSPDRDYFLLLQDKLPGASDDVVAYAMLEAKRGGLTDPSRVAPNEIGAGEDGRIWIGGNWGERIEVDPARAPPVVRTTQDLDTHAFEQTQRQQEPARQQSSCLMM